VTVQDLCGCVCEDFRRVVLRMELAKLTISRTGELRDLIVASCMLQMHESAHKESSTRMTPLVSKSG
jgi:hypothetical protein